MESPRTKNAFHNAHLVERGVLWALLVMLLGIAALATLQLFADIVQVIASRDGWQVISPDELFFVFEALFLVLIALELLETIVLYLKERVFHVGGIILVAITAIARKIIVLNIDKYDPVTIIGLAAIVVALGVGYYLVSKFDTVSCDWEEE